MTNTPLISIIIPVYRVEKYLRNCVDSVLAQTYGNWELILVDDGSPDRCPAICDEYAARDERVKVIHQNNGGAAKARNAALEVFAGDYVTFLDADDFWHRDYLKEMLSLCMDNDVEIAQCRYIRGNDTSFPSVAQERSVRVYKMHGAFVAQVTNILRWGKLYRREIWHDLRMTEGKAAYEDDFTTWKAYYRAKKIAATNSPLYYYTNNGESVMASMHKELKLDFLDAYRERINFFENTKEKDLEDVSRCQLQKSILLSYAHKSLTRNNRGLLRQLGG